MADRTTPNLPSNDFAKTEAFYGALGFKARFKDDGWMILDRGPLTIEFFPMRHEPSRSWFSACIRVDDLDALHAEFSKAGVATDSRSVPRLTAPKLEPFGLRMFALVDPDGSLIRCLENPSGG